MKRMRHIAILGVFVGLAGCGNVTRLSQFTEKSIRITSIDTNFVKMRLRFDALCYEISRGCDQRVEMLPSWDTQAAKVRLENRGDFYHLLYLDPVQFCQISETTKLTAIAMRQNLRGVDNEVGLIVVPSNSEIRTMGDVRGKRFAFGPYGSPYRFYNVLELMREAKVPTSLLKADNYSDNDASVVRKLLLGLADVGVVTETWWETTTDRKLNFSGLLKDDLRIIARTKPLPEYVWAATDALSEEQRDSLREVLTVTVAENTRILSAFEARCFTAVQDKDLADLPDRIGRIKNLPPKPLLAHLH